VVPEIIVKALRDERLRMTEGLQTREFNYVEDLTDGFIRAAKVPGIEGEVFNLGGGEEVSMRDLATTILDLMGNPISAEFGALPNRPNEIWSMRSDVTKARDFLGLKPARPLREGLERTISWYRQELQKSGSLFSG
jgi:nucleoside-diphosphate-sugar epimerase